MFKIISQLKPTAMVFWATVAEQYRIACGELEFRQPAVIEKFFKENKQIHEEAYWKIW